MFRRISVIVAFLAVASALLATFGQAAAADLVPVRLRLDWVWQAPQAIFTYAKERGFYKDEGLDVTIDRGYGGPENATALASGNYEFVFGDMGTAILFNGTNTTGRKLISVMTIYDAYLGTIITRAGNGIKTPKDLEGKTIGAPLTTGGRTMFPAFAAANGVDATKVDWQTIGIQLQDQQFAQGKFDAIASFSTTSLLNLKQLGVPRDKLTVFNFADYGVDLYGTGLLTRDDYLRSNPELVGKFVRASIRGINAMLADKKAAIESLKKRDPLLDADIELDRLNLMIELTLQRAPVQQHGVGYVDPARVRRSIDTFVKVFDVKPPRLEDVYTDKFLPPEPERVLKF